MRNRIFALVVAVLAVFGVGIATSVSASAATYQGTKTVVYTMQAGSTAEFSVQWYTSTDGLGNQVEAAYWCKVKNNSLVTAVVWKSSTLLNDSNGDAYAWTQDDTVSPAHSSPWLQCTASGAWMLTAYSGIHVDFRAASAGWNYSSFRVDDFL